MITETIGYLILAPIGIGLLNGLLPTPVRKGLAFLLTCLTSWHLLAIWTHPPALFPLFSLDRLALLCLLASQVLGLLIALFALHGMRPEQEKPFFVLHPLTLGFTNGALMADHLLLFVFFWGLSGLALYLFGLLGKGEGAPEAAKKTFILVGGSDAFLLLGMALLALRSPEPLWSMGRITVPLTGSALGAFFCLLVAALAKAGGFPLHTWVPSFAKESPIEAVALLPASLDKILGIYLLARMVRQLFQCTILVHLILMTIGAITVIAAVMMALIQHDGRRLLGYHAVSQVGYMILGVASGMPIAVAGGLFHLLNNTIYKTSLFLTLGSVEKRTGTDDLDALGGLGQKMPITLIMALIGAFSISGIPPFNGFFSKWMIYQGLLVQARDARAGYALWILVCLILAVFGSALTLASFLKFLHAVFLGRPSRDDATLREAPVNQWLATGFLSLLCLAFGLWAYAVPLSLGILPVVDGGRLDWLGLYRPRFLLFMIAVAFGLGWILYRATRRIRFDTVYLGGMEASARFRITGAAFYKEIREMVPIRWFYDQAEKGFFDLKEILTRGTLGLSHWFQKAHPGLLSLYLLFIMAGMLALMVWIP